MTRLFPWFTAFLVGLTLLSFTRALGAQGEGPCALLTTAEVQRAFPGSQPGKLDRKNEKRGVLACVWSTPTGVLSIISGDDTGESPKDEAEGWTLTFLDPLRDDAQRHVRYETLAGVGDQAVAVVERQDKTKGFAQNGAILVVRRGKRQISVLSTELARRERAEALLILADLGKAIAKRLN
jgi:hypothetical protein